ncbi:Alpha/beta hydrolase family protein [Caulifigura coniformis]|uniref:Alpha/beta hydrolase family protein n=1 Tax=Caulifigura coniformis TaxID=2527983 RepID=A0A517SAI7_9PLAN|nr:prolyl oligopeptidase family serine peptidase [Caulifigura coniformis]QDT53140.1 Alpha/beta hydrolase family protein [Caulifigura coniformis]
MLLRVVVACCLLSPSLSQAAEKPFDSSNGDALVAEYFRLETGRLTRETADHVPDLVDPKVRQERRRQLRDMLGIDPLPEKTPLNAVVTGTINHPEFTVEKLHFQSSPGLYVTANLYIPRNLKGKAPTVLYVCGHSVQKKNDISFGNKAGYQHHGGWFARNGFVCLTFDTLQLGEIPGIHHGTFRENRWWWLPRGYTPAGVEAWNCIRALDYLETRPEVDAQKIGVTGRSGGGAYSWWIAGIDDRIQAAVPVAGITSLQNHVVDGVITGHCDCMFQCNTYRWDYSMIPGLFAPKPLLISNTDKDRIFPVDGVFDVYMKTRGVYAALKAEKNLGLQITEGPHKDTQELHIHAFVWMNRFLKGEETPIEDVAVKFFQPEELRVFDQLPKDEINTRIDEVFVPLAATPAVPAGKEEWTSLASRLREGLDDKVFRGWPDHEPTAAELEVKLVSESTRNGMRIEKYEFTSQLPYRLPLWVVSHGEQKGPATVIPVDDQGWPALQAWLGEMFPVLGMMGSGTANAALAQRWKGLLEAPGSTLVFSAPRGIGPTEWTRTPLPRAHLRRRFALLGQTDDGMRTWDVRCALKAARSLGGLQGRPVRLLGTGDASVWTLYASLYEPPTEGVTLAGLPSTHAEGPTLLNVLRVLDVPVAVALAGGHAPVVVETGDRTQKSVTDFATQTAARVQGNVIRIEAK